ncbi:unnamed protein product [Mytilus coruscus]|uniref:PHD-type domain-containing protein n=1 Tax=Mytilus coruscus TaxID=42192 RepID=A0A6J8C334_MYTCO|nr:unnamed protein product [Mytilus coruscus]
MKTEDYLITFTKGELNLLCKAYRITVTLSKTKAQISTILNQTILNSANMSNPSALDKDGEKTDHVEEIKKVSSSSIPIGKEGDKLSVKRKIVKKVKGGGRRKVRNRCCTFSKLLNPTTPGDTCKKLLSEVLSKYCIMSLGQLRKTYLKEAQTIKTEAHRKQIKMRGKGRSNVDSVFNLDTIKEDTTKQKDMSYKRLQYEVMKTEDYLITFTKGELNLLCKAYRITVTLSKTKAQISTILNQTILNSANMSNPSALDKDGEKTDHVEEIKKVSSSSIPIGKEGDKLSVKRKIVKKVKGGGKKKSKKSVCKYPCGVCRKECSWNVVGCDECDTWYHADCIQVEDLDELPDEWLCNTCKDELENMSYVFDHNEGTITNLKINIKTDDLEQELVEEDTTKQKDMSYKRLQYEVMKTEDYLITFTKGELNLLCKAYRITVTLSKTKAQISTILNQTILNSANMSNPSALDKDGEKTDHVEEIEKVSSSTIPIEKERDKLSVKRKIVKKVKGGGKKKNKKSVCKYPCGVCRKECSWNVVGCDGCDTWYHADCI